MTLSKAIKTLSELKASIAANSVVSFDDTTELLEFVEPYVRSNNKQFQFFKAALLKAREDGKITSEESSMIIKEINSIIRFLRTEQVIEVAFVAVVIAVVGFGILHMLFS